VTFFCTYHDASQHDTCGVATGAEATHAVLDYQYRGHWTVYSRAQLSPLPPEVEDRVVLFCAQHAQQIADRYNAEGR
jgi:hypothetical protein